MTLHFFERTQLPASPWKNGGGVTREIACHPPSANMQDFDWRISIAHIARDGDFSVFAGLDRVITLLEGGGVHLSSTDGSVLHALDTPLQPFAFSGDAAVHGRLLNGDCHDFNVMTRRGVCQAEVRVLRRDETLLPAPAGLLMAMRGAWRVQTPDTDNDMAEVQPYAMAPQTGLWWQGSTQGWSCQCADSDPQAALLAVRFTPTPR